ncbi:SHOCT domain-containing protein [Myroides sp. NP-2]|uniref:SHOCT domain-containing protein n=1 Tax=unclassified Myroides TaxID=2642485 RepID=UPI0015FAB075|nr:SHOCT domain-containing protein [Myroides sp. NP-2]MBB1151299.1 SHOCT domain-containing protein [Myroides sp. NP-2]
MKQENKFLNTVFIIFLGLILVSMFKYFHFLKQPEFIQDQYQSFVSYPGVGGILSILTITGAMFLVINIWKKSKEEKLIESGKENEVEKIKKLFAEGILTEKEVHNKFDILLTELKKETEENDLKAKSKRENELIGQLAELKNKGLLTETEFELKKEQVLSGKQIETE